MTVGEILLSIISRMDARCNLQLRAMLRRVQPKKLVFLSIPFRSFLVFFSFYEYCVVYSLSHEAKRSIDRNLIAERRDCVIYQAVCLF